MDAKAKNWDDLRVFLAVARAGSLSGAARALSVNHSTVFRRIGAFEAALGVRLFERQSDGYLLTPAGEELRDGALRIEEEIASLSRKVAGQDLRLSGAVRVTTIDMLAFGLLPRHLARFRDAYPGIEIELVVGNTMLNLSRREADVALRVGNTPPETLVGRRVGRLALPSTAASATAPAGRSLISRCITGSVSIPNMRRLFAGSPAFSPRSSRRCVQTLWWPLSPQQSQASGSYHCPADSRILSLTSCGLRRCLTTLLSISGC